MITLFKYGRLSRRIREIMKERCHRDNMADTPLSCPNRRLLSKTPDHISTRQHACTRHFFLKEKPALEETLKSRRCFVDTLHCEVRSIMTLIRHNTLAENSLDYPNKALPHYDNPCHCQPDLDRGTFACGIVMCENRSVENNGIKRNRERYIQRRQEFFCFVNTASITSLECRAEQLLLLWGLILRSDR